MAKLAGKKARFYVDAQDIYLSSFEMEYGVESVVVDASVYNDDFDQNEVIGANGRFSLSARLTDSYRAAGDVSATLGITLTATITPTQTVFQYTGADVVHVGMIIEIDSEKMKVLGLIAANNDLQVIRGYSDTAAVQHTIGATIFLSGDTLSDKYFRNLFTDPATDRVKATPAVISAVIRNTPVIGDRALFTRGYGQMAINAVPRDLARINFQAQETGPIHLGRILYLPVAAPITTTEIFTTAVDFGRAAFQYIRASLHIFRYVVDSGTPSIRIRIQSDSGGGFGTPINALTFADLANIGQEWKEVISGAGIGVGSNETFFRTSIQNVGTGQATISGILVMDCM